MPGYCPNSPFAQQLSAYPELTMLHLFEGGALERSLDLEPDHAGAEPRFHHVQAAGPWAWNFISLNLNFLMEKKQGLTAHSSHRPGRRTNETMDKECLIGERCSVSGGRHYSLWVGVKYQYHKGKPMPTLGPLVWEPNTCMGPKPGWAKFNLPCFSVCKHLCFRSSQAGFLLHLHSGQKLPSQRGLLDLLI